MSSLNTESAMLNTRDFIETNIDSLRGLRIKEVVAKAIEAGVKTSMHYVIVASRHLGVYDDLLKQRQAGEKPPKMKERLAALEGRDRVLAARVGDLEADLSNLREWVRAVSGRVNKLGAR